MFMEVDNVGMERYLLFEDLINIIIHKTLINGLTFKVAMVLRVVNLTTIRFGWIQTAYERLKITKVSGNIHDGDYSFNSIVQY